MSAFAMEQLQLRLRARASQEYPLDVPVPGPVFGEHNRGPRSVASAPEPSSPDFEGVESAGAFGSSDPWSLLQDDQDRQAPDLPEIFSDHFVESDRPDEPLPYSPNTGDAVFTEDEREWYSQVQDHDFGLEALNDEGSEPQAPDESNDRRPLPSRVLWLQGKPAEVDASQMVLEAVNKKRRLDLARQPWQAKPSHLEQSYNMFFPGPSRFGGTRDPRDDDWERPFAGANRQDPVDGY